MESVLICSEKKKKQEQKAGSPLVVTILTMLVFSWNRFFSIFSTQVESLSKYSLQEENTYTHGYG